jgi:hypothetical protein
MMEKPRSVIGHCYDGRSRSTVLRLGLPPDVEEINSDKSESTHRKRYQLQVFIGLAGGGELSLAVTCIRISMLRPNSEKNFFSFCQTAGLRIEPFL